MMRILLIFLILLSSVLAANAQPTLLGCHNQSAVAYGGATPRTEIVPAIPDKKVGSCGEVLIAGNNPASVSFSYGTGTNCGTDTVETDTFAMPNNGILVNHLASVFAETPPGRAVCVTITGSGSISGVFYWTRF